MLRAQYERRGPVPQDVIEVVECETPRLKAGQALVEVVAAPINPADVLTLTGEYGVLPPLPAIGGREGVGRVARLRCRRGRGGSGGIAAARLRQLVQPCRYRDGAAEVVAGRRRPAATVDDGDQPADRGSAVERVRDAGPDDWVIQNAANSAVGSYLVQLARYRGYRTVNVVRRQDAAAVVRENGGDIVLVDGEDLAERVVETTGTAAIRLGIDAVSGAASQRLADCLCESATLVSYGRLSGQPCAVQPDAFIFRDLTLRGFWLVNWFRRTPEDKRRVLVDELAGLIARKILHAPIHATYDVSEIKEAVATAASGERSGKVLIVPRR
jgi:trans-2-enoyl-CoA reductase